MTRHQLVIFSSPLFVFSVLHHRKLDTLWGFSGGSQFWEHGTLQGSIKSIFVLCGEPGWLSWRSMWLLISGLWVQALYWVWKLLKLFKKKEKVSLHYEIRPWQKASLPHKVNVEDTFTKKKWLRAEILSHSFWTKDSISN